MNITKMRTVGLNTVDLPIIGARPSDQFSLRAVDGLGPVETDVFISGGVYQGREPHPREIVMRVGLNANWSVGQTPESLRTLLYGLLTPGVNDDFLIQLLDGDTVVAQTPGYVQKIETAIFAKDPEVQITIESTDAYLSAPEEVVVTPVGLYHFTIDNPGTAPTGFYLKMNLTAAMAQQALYLLPPPPQLPRILFNYDFHNGDILEFDTREGQRFMQVTRGSTVTDLVRALDVDSVWPTMHHGSNDFWTLNQNFSWGEFRFTPQYWGI